MKSCRQFKELFLWTLRRKISQSSTLRFSIFHWNFLRYSEQLTQFINKPRIYFFSFILGKKKSSKAINETSLNKCLIDYHKGKEIEWVEKRVSMHAKGKYRLSSGICHTHEALEMNFLFIISPAFLCNKNFAFCSTARKCFLSQLPVLNKKAKGRARRTSQYALMGLVGDLKSTVGT